MNAIELGVLQACQEVMLRQRELAPLLAKSLQPGEAELLYAWALAKRRKLEQHGSIEGADWTYFFHGLECDLKNKADQRFLRMDFGPRGELGTFTEWGVLQFIMTSTHPWPDFRELKLFFAKSGPPFDEHSGDFHKMVAVWERLEAAGALKKTAAALVDLMAKHTAPGPDGIPLVRFPPGTPEETSIDCSVARRQRISVQGQRILEQQMAAV